MLPTTILLNRFGMMAAHTVRQRDAVEAPHGARAGRSLRPVSCEPVVRTRGGSTEAVTASAAAYTSHKRSCSAIAVKRLLDSHGEHAQVADVLRRLEHPSRQPRGGHLRRSGWQDCE